MSIEKIARIVKRKNKYCVIGHKKDKTGKYKNFGCYETEKEAKERLQQIYMFKHKKAFIMNVMTTASDNLEEKGMIHISDAINYCTEEIATDSSSEKTAIRLMKVVNSLEKRGEFDLAEQLDAIIPEILDKSNKLK